MAIWPPLAWGSYFFSAACKGAVLEGGLAESKGEVLIDVVIGKAFGFTSRGLLLSGDGKRRERFDGLPGTLIDEVVTPGATFALTKRHVRHRAASEPDCDETKNEE